MTKTEHTTVFFVDKKEFAASVDRLLKQEGEDYTLTMTIRRSKSGEFSASDVTLHYVGTSR